jgi:general secretion pathway protein F/type IV pilus assembly protein PilC
VERVPLRVAANRGLIGMPDFNFEAMAGTGQRSAGTLTANSEREAMALLDARGLFPLRIELAKSAVNVRRGGKRVGSRQMATFYSQLADLLRSGVPLLRSLEILERQSTAPALSDILREVHVKVADGTSLADAMAQYPGAFNELGVSMVRAGQEGGFLEDVLERIAVFTEHQEDLKAKVIGALAYPAFLALTGFIVLNVLIIFFVPKFQPIFDKLESKGELPALTQGLIAVSQALQTHFVWLGLGGLALLVGFRQWATSSAGRVIMDGWRLRLPIAGKVFLSLALSRFTRILGTLLHNGIPILQALRIAKDSTGNRVLTAAIDQAAENVTGGKRLAEPLAMCKYFPRDVVEMITVGEESNQLEKVLVNVADALEKRTARQLELMVRLLEPLMLLVMALITLLVVAGLLLPVFKMSSAVR